MDDYESDGALALLSELLESHAATRRRRPGGICGARLEIAAQVESRHVAYVQIASVLHNNSESLLPHARAARARRALRAAHLARGALGALRLPLGAAPVARHP
jgi:hypothetical protein